MIFFRSMQCVPGIRDFLFFFFLFFKVPFSVTGFISLVERPIFYTPSVFSLLPKHTVVILLPVPYIGAEMT